MIDIISSNILQSSLETERLSSERLQSARVLNFSSITLRRDLRQIKMFHCAIIMEIPSKGHFWEAILIKGFHLIPKLNPFLMKHLLLKGLNTNLIMTNL